MPILTKHTCGGPLFGRFAPEGECPRCDELRQGSAPRPRFNNIRAAQAAERRAHYARQRLIEIRNHDCPRSGCGPVCTAFDW